MPSETDRCRSCGAPVIFVPSSKTGRTMILDAKPKKGVVVVLDVGTFAGETFMFEQPDEMGSVALVVDVYTDHHVTCPHAADWKGRSRSNPPGEGV